MLPSTLLGLFIQVTFVTHVMGSSDVETPLTVRLLEAAGGRTNLDLGIRNISTHASSFRNGTGNSIEPAGQGDFGFVCKITFEDGVSWAAKIVENSFYEDAEMGLKSLIAIEEFCPEIPVPLVFGDIYSMENTSLYYFFTSWVEGRHLEFDRDYLVSFSEVGKYRLTMPEKVVEEFAQFLYNLTMCPIRNWKVEDIVRHLSDSVDPERGRVPTAVDWATRCFYSKYNILTSEPSTPPYDGLDKMLLLAWTTACLAEINDWKFSLDYWDLRVPNVLFDDNLNIAGVIDWDFVEPVPMKLCAVSLGHRLNAEGESEGDRYHIDLDPDQDELYRQTIRQIEDNRTSNHDLSKLYLESQENLILTRILRFSFDIPSLMEYHEDILAEPLTRSQKNLEAARAQWDNLVDESFRKRGRGLPDWPIFVEIQEGLGIYGSRLKRRIKSLWEKQVFRTVNVLSAEFPKWKWAAKKRCYLESVFSNVYERAMSDYCQWAIE